MPTVYSHLATCIEWMAFHSPRWQASNWDHAKTTRLTTQAEFDALAIQLETAARPYERPFHYARNRHVRDAYHR